MAPEPTTGATATRAPPALRVEAIDPAAFSTSDLIGAIIDKKAGGESDLMHALRDRGLMITYRKPDQGALAGLGLGPKKEPAPATAAVAPTTKPGPLKIFPKGSVGDTIPLISKRSDKDSGRGHSRTESEGASMFALKGLAIVAMAPVFALLLDIALLVALIDAAMYAPPPLPPP